MPSLRGSMCPAGWKGLTFAEAVRTFPLPTFLGAAAAGFGLASAIRRR